MAGTTGLEPKTSCVTVPREMVLPFLQKPKVSDEKVSRRLFYELRTELAIAGKNPDQIAESLQTAYVKGELPRKDGVSFAYMWSAGQNPGSGIGHWHRHMMVFCLYYENSMAGGNESGSSANHRLAGRRLRCERPQLYVIWTTAFGLLDTKSK